MTRSLGKPILVVATAVVVLSVAAGIVVIGSPSDGRLQELDSGRIADLRGIMGATDLFWSRNERLPGALEELAEDPRTSINTVDPGSTRPYSYRILDDDTYAVRHLRSRIICIAGQIGSGLLETRSGSPMLRGGGGQGGALGEALESAV